MMLCVWPLTLSLSVYGLVRSFGLKQEKEREGLSYEGTERLFLG